MCALSHAFGSSNILIIILFFYCYVQKRRDIGQPYGWTVLNPTVYPLQEFLFHPQVIGSLSIFEGTNHVDKALTGLSVKIPILNKPRLWHGKWEETNKYTFCWNLNVEQRNKNTKSNWNQFLLVITTMGLCPSSPATPFPQIVLIPIFTETEFFILILILGVTS